MADLELIETAEQILQADDLKHEDVPCKEWGGMVRVRAMTGAERDEFESKLMVQVGPNDRRVNLRGMRARTVAMLAVNSRGEKLFTDKQVKDLAKKNAAPLDRIFDVVQRISGIDKGATDEALGKSEADQSGASTTD